MQQRSAVIFDLYGTLVDVRVDENRPDFWENLASEFLGVERNVYGDALGNAYARLIQEEAMRGDEGFLLDKVFANLLRELGISPTRDNLGRFAHQFRKHSIIRLVKKPYTDQLLQDIRQSHYKLGLLSNTEALLTAYDLRKLELEDRFDAIALSSSLGFKKPDREAFDGIRRLLGVDANQCVFVGDNFDDDIAGARNAGIDAVFLTRSPGITPICKGGYRDGIICAALGLRAISAALGQLGFALPGGRP